MKAGRVYVLTYEFQRYSRMSLEHRSNGARGMQKGALPGCTGPTDRHLEIRSKPADKLLQTALTIEESELYCAVRSSGPSGTGPDFRRERWLKPQFVSEWHRRRQFRLRASPSLTTQARARGGGGRTLTIGCHSRLRFPRTSTQFDKGLSNASRYTVARPL